MLGAIKNINIVAKTARNKFNLFQRTPIVTEEREGKKGGRGRSYFTIVLAGLHVVCISARRYVLIPSK